MKGSILVFSQTGNTLKVGTSISKGLKIFGADVDQVNFLHRNRWKPDNADLIGIGCPVFENILSGKFLGARSILLYFVQTGVVAGIPPLYILKL